MYESMLGCFEAKNLYSHEYLFYVQMNVQLLILEGVCVCVCVYTGSVDQLEEILSQFEELKHTQ